MRPPWIEASALLGAAGFKPSPKNYRPPIWNRFTMQPAPYALLTQLNAVVRPVVFTDLHALAAHLHRARSGQGLDMVEIEDLHHQWRAEGGGQGVDAPQGVPDRGVQVWTLDLGNNRDRCLGWAWLNGGGLDTLRAALRRAETTPRPRASNGMGLIADDSAYESRRRRAAILGCADHFNTSKVA